MLADDDGADERHDSDEDPNANDGIYEHERRICLVAVVQVEAREDKD